jgi:Protein of unknown function (DUF2442)
MVKARTSEAEILAQIPAARAREVRNRKAGQRAIAVRYDRRAGRVLVDLTNGYLFGFPAKSIPALAKATPSQLAQVELSPAGTGLHWEALDVDLSVSGLLLATVRPSDKLRELARIAGSTTSPAKAAAARKNGVKGGRPRQVVG